MNGLSFLLVALGGATGAVARYGASTWINRTFPVSLPLGTIFVNIVGSFLIGLLMVFFIKSGEGSANTRLLLVTGILGGFTTFSSFSWETWLLIENSRFSLAFTNIFLSVAVCLIATWAGVMLAKQFA